MSALVGAKVSLLQSKSLGVRTLDLHMDLETKNECRYDRLFFLNRDCKKSKDVPLNRVYLMMQKY